MVDFFVRKLVTALAKTQRFLWQDKMNGYPNIHAIAHLNFTGKPLGSEQ
jgi:hypothetical protein